MKAKWGKYNYNEDFFFNETPELAYFLGYFMSDGYMCCGNDNKYRITFGLSYIDEYILKTFIYWICPELKITRQTVIQDTGYVSHFSRIDINNKKIVSHLKQKYRINTDKTFNEVIPYGLDKSLLSHFIRGAFDGDGCVYLGKNNRPLASICAGSYQYLADIKDILGYGSINKLGGIYNLRIANNEDVIKFRNYMYENDCLSLHRKKTIFYENNNDKKFTNLHQDEIDFIKENTNKLTSRQIADILNRDYTTICELTARNGRKTNDRYTEEDDIFLMEYFNSNKKPDLSFLAEKFNTTETGINSRKVLLGFKKKLRKVTKFVDSENIKVKLRNDDSISLLRVTQDKISQEESTIISDYFDINIATVKNKLRKAGIGMEKGFNIYTEDEDAYIKMNFDNTRSGDSAREIALFLQKPVDGIYHKALRMGLVNQKRVVTAEEILFIKENLHKGVTWISKNSQLGITTVKRYRDKIKKGLV